MPLNLVSHTFTEIYAKIFWSLIKSRLEAAMNYGVGRCLLPDILREIGWSQQELADYTGLDKRTISFYATGARKKMPLIMAVCITDTINAKTCSDFSPRDLYEWTVRGES